MSVSHSDEEARFQAAAAVEEGTTIIRNHLSSHMNENPDSSYVTWIATLHPENASVTIDTRFFVPNNPWWAAYEDHKPDMPSVAAVPISVTDINGTHNPSDFTVQQRNVNNCLVCSPLVMITASSLTLFAFLTVNALEIAAICLYFFSAGCFLLSVQRVKVVCLYPLYALAKVHYFIFSMVDSILLMLSVLVAEFLAGAAFVLVLIMGGFLVACSWHQYIRRSCHVARHVYRKAWNPPRRFMCLYSEDSADASPFCEPVVVTTAMPDHTSTVANGKGNDEYCAHDDNLKSDNELKPTLATVPTAPYDHDDY